MPAFSATSASSWSELADRLAEQLGRRWRAGERPIVEEYFERFPGLRDQPEAAIELIYEEICLRHEFGKDERGTDEVLHRFPQWHERLQALIACHRLLESGSVSSSFPAAGEDIAGFHLLAELGRGVRGRVFLAKQAELADRPVVLKLAPRVGQEHLSLARLQHTHIVPLHSVIEDVARDVRILCMPYFGGASLARILSRLVSQSPARRTGADLVAALRLVQSAAPVPMPVEGPACQFLGRTTYTRAICRMAVYLADALQYTHERGLVHLDLKPSNVLLAADGQPMLLDLHLARPPIPAGTPAPSWLGGTPGYMAPEHRRALAAVRQRRRVETVVDGRADIFALGVLLCEALCGALPPPGHATSAWLRQGNPEVTPGLADIVQKCLAEDPGQRYCDAAGLATDLRCHLADLPLRGVANRSPIERWRKWRRRQPSRLPLAGLLLAMLAGSGLVLAYVKQEEGKAQVALEEGREHFLRREYGPARDWWQRGLVMVQHLPFQHELTEELQDQLREVERAETALELHRFVDGVRAVYGADGQSITDLRAVEQRCRDFWDKRDLIVERLTARAGSAERAETQNDLLDLAILWTALRARLVPSVDADATRKEALDILDLAESLFGRSCVLDCERRLRNASFDRSAVRLSSDLSPRTAWEHYAVGRALFRSGNLPEAEAQFDRALALDRRSLWPHFYKGACAYRAARYEDAVLAFTACTVLAPERAWAFYNRGLAYDAMKQLDRALADYDRALELEPALPLAALNRAMIHYRAGRVSRAFEDLQLAQDAGADPALLHYDRALIHLAREDRSAALDCLNKALKIDPGNAQARALLKQMQPP